MVIPTYKIAVRSLVEHVLRSGDLRSDFWGAVQAVEGIRAHQHVQRRRPSDYESEVTVQGEVVQTDFILVVSGRIDGVIRSDSLVSIEEIKTTRTSFEDLGKNPNTIHWGQAQCYAYLLAKQEGLASIEIRLTYVQPDSWTERTFMRLMTMDELDTFFNEVVYRYLEWMNQIITWKRLKDESLKQLTFPFETYREGQRALAVEVYRTIRDEKQLIAQAATGIGKTMAVLFPALKSLEGNTTAKVVFLTARTTGRLVAEAAFDKLRNNGARFKTITITAKDKICFVPDAACVPEECPYAEGYFDRLGDALTEAFGADAFTREVIEALAEKHKICPFEFSLELVNWSDGVIGDYNYAFDPQVVLQRLFLEEGDKHIVLVDEAHNLVDRSREMFSAQLDKAPVLSMRRTLKAELPRLSKLLTRINSWMATARRECREQGGTRIDVDAPSTLIDLLREFIARAEKWLRQNIKTPFRDDLIALFFEFVGFVKVSEQYNQCYATIMLARSSDYSIRLFCIDPAEQLRQAWNRCRAAVLFSATLTPADYFQSVLGCRSDITKLGLPSPFPEDNLMVLVASGISTYYRQRKRTQAAICRLLIDLVGNRTGHYLFFFPSYEYLEMVHQQFAEDCGDIEIIVQARDMAEGQRKDFIEKFKNPIKGTLVGFAVMGGIFGEGIDLRGEWLTGAVIVGVGLPGISPERELIRGYFDKLNGAGFEFAYQYPGVTRVLQAAGRVIRSEHDRGVVLLIDQRYAADRYVCLLPKHWRLSYLSKVNGIKERMEAFWNLSDQKFL